MRSFSTRTLYTSSGHSSVSSISAARGSIFSSAIVRTSRRNSSSSSGSSNRSSSAIALRDAPQDEGVALSAASADRRAAEVHAAPAHLVRQGEDEARAARADGMAEGDRAAVHVDELLVEPEHTGHVQRDGGERLVHLEQAEVVHVELSPLERVLQ